MPYTISLNAVLRVGSTICPTQPTVDQAGGPFSFSLQMVSIVNFAWVRIRVELEFLTCFLLSNFFLLELSNFF